MLRKLAFRLSGYRIIVPFPVNVSAVVLSFDFEQSPL